MQDFVVTVFDLRILKAGMGIGMVRCSLQYQAFVQRRPIHPILFLRNASAPGPVSDPEFVGTAI